MSDLYMRLIKQNKNYSIQIVTCCSVCIQTLVKNVNEMIKERKNKNEKSDKTNTKCTETQCNLFQWALLVRFLCARQRLTRARRQLVVLPQSTATANWIFEFYRILSQSIYYSNSFVFFFDSRKLTQFKQLNLEKKRFGVLSDALRMNGKTVVKCCKESKIKCLHV